MLKSDYDVNKVSEKTKEAMRDRCHEQGHYYENCCSAIFEIYQKCKWCGEIK